MVITFDGLYWMVSTRVAYSKHYLLVANLKQISKRSLDMVEWYLDLIIFIWEKADSQK